jgi:hypothetical protein
VAEDDDPGPVRFVLLRPEVPSQDRPFTKNVQEAVGNPGGGYHFGLSPCGERHLSIVVAGE